ncbi:MAG: adenosylcobinamide kinase/adenosylcobinamide-phosphate guanylyltransferase [Clostridium butyricum]|nr:adenosylcobinamide kinase/adenosylcobinamide-phosphate guanylyltransferase [Clostridium butyricum]
MNYLIIGGSKSGKSDIAERISLELNKNKVIYIATMKPYDDEDKKRIEAHIRKRYGYNFVTIEKTEDIDELSMSINSQDTVLIDSITSLLNNEMFKGNIINNKAGSKIVSDIKKIIDKRCNTVIVSDYIFNDSIQYDEVTENYKKQLAFINKKLAQYSDKVIECVFGVIKVWKDDIV